MVEAKQVTKNFGQLIALDHVDLTINSGEFVFLTGPSGSGKTTLLRMMLRDLIPDSGQFIVNGQNLQTIKSRKIPYFRRDIGVVYQDFKLLSDRNILENVALPLEVRGINQKDIQKAVALALEMVDLHSKQTLFPAQLSGGEVQRVGIARAIVAKPKLLLADEPTGNLDPRTAKTIVKLLKEVHTHLKTTVVMATHNAEIVNLYNLRVVSLEHGKITKDHSSGTYD